MVEQRRTGQREMTEMNDVPVRHAALLRRVLAHRRDHDAIGELQRSDPERCEQFCARHRPPHEFAERKVCRTLKNADQLKGRGVPVGIIPDSRITATSSG